MERWLRYTLALTVCFVLFVSSMVVAGQQAAQEAPPDDSPALFGTEPSHPGDRGLYKTALVVVKDGRGEYVDMNAHYAFERLPDEPMLDAEGGAHAVSSFVGEWRTDYYSFDLREALEMPELDLPALRMPDCMPTPPGANADEDDWDDYEDAVDDCADEMAEAGEEYGEAAAEAAEEYGEAMAEWVPLLDQERHIVQASDWHVTHHAGNQTVATTVRNDTAMVASVPVKPSLVGEDAPHSIDVGALQFTQPLPVPGPCGWRTSLQEGPQDMWRPITVHGECPPDMELGYAAVDHFQGPLSLRVSGEDRVDGRSAVVFSMPWDEDALRLWFVEDTPYPLRILTRTTSVPPAIQEALGGGYDAPAFYVLHELVEFEAGTESSATTPPAFGAMATDGPAWGPDPGALAHPWPLAQAVDDAAMDPADCAEWALWLRDHPDAGAGRASYAAIHSPSGNAEPIIDETWNLIAQDGGAAVAVTLHRHAETTTGSPLTGPVRIPDVWCSAPVPVQAGSAGPWPELGDALERAGWLGASATGYGFHGGVLVLEDGPTTPGQDGPFQRLSLSEGLVQWARADTPYPEPRFSDPSWDPHADGAWTIQTAERGEWVMPRPATAATLGVAAASAGALIILLPAIKGLFGFLPMFSRIREEDLLEHPVRGSIMEALEADPGLHFQELVRRIGKGRGTMEHHIRKLVAADLLVEKAEKGFNCYFPKGRVDRHLMAAAPLMKAAGARNVMSAVCAQPGTVAMQVAEHLGMSTSTVNYHIKRLTAAGLVTTERKGRFIALQATQLGDEAVARYVRT